MNYEEYFFRLEDTDEGFEDLDEEKILYEFREIEFPKTAGIFLDKYGAGWVKKNTINEIRTPKWGTMIEDCIEFSKIRPEIVFSIEVFEMRDFVPDYRKYYFEAGNYSEVEAEIKYPEHYEIPNDRWGEL